MEKGPFTLNPNGKLECKRCCLEEGSFKFLGLQVCVDFKKTYHGGILAYFQPFIFSQKKNIEFWLIEMCSVLTFFNCNFRKILLKCNFQWLFLQNGEHCFCGNETKTSSNRVPDRECDISCYGNLDESCGGFWRIYIFTNE